MILRLQLVLEGDGGGKKILSDRVLRGPKDRPIRPAVNDTVAITYNLEHTFTEEDLSFG